MRNTLFGLWTLLCMGLALCAAQAPAAAQGFGNPIPQVYSQAFVARYPADTPGWMVANTADSNVTLAYIDSVSYYEWQCTAATSYVMVSFSDTFSVQAENSTMTPGNDPAALLQATPQIWPVVAAATPSLSIRR